MPVWWDIHNRILILTVIRDWTGPGLASSIDQCLTHPNFESGAALLLDARQSEMNPSAEEVESRTRWISIQGHGEVGGSYQINTRAIEMQGGGSITLTSPTNPFLRFVCALIE
jgi:hypothetical protein